MQLQDRSWILKLDPEAGSLEIEGIDTDWFLGHGFEFWAMVSSLFSGRFQGWLAGQAKPMDQNQINPKLKVSGKLASEAGARAGNVRFGRVAF